MLIKYTIGMTTLAARLKFVFNKKPELTKTGLYKACNLSSGAISQWFSGQTKELKGDNLLNAAEYLGVSADWLSSGKGDPFKAAAKQPNKDYKKTLVVGGITINSNEKNLVDQYRKLSAESRNVLDMLANHLSSIEDPSNRQYKPYPNRPSKKVTYLGNVEDQPGENDAKHIKNRRVQKQGND